MTLLIEPLKERLILHRKTLWGAFLESLVIAILAAMVLELVMGWLINQPDPTTGEYPFWDNSQLPGNVFGQAWLVNDFFIGLVAMIYVWAVSYTHLDVYKRQAQRRSPKRLARDSSNRPRSPPSHPGRCPRR